MKRLIIALSACLVAPSPGFCGQSEEDLKRFDRFATYDFKTTECDDDDKGPYQYSCRNIETGDISGYIQSAKLEEDATGRFLGKYWGTGDRERERQSTALVVNVNSLDAYAVELTFFSDTYRNRAWPGGNQVYILSDSAVHTYRLNCRKGGKICFGVRRRGNTNSW